jgi:hypothetical protein
MTQYALYIDDSGHPDNQPNVVAAGFVSTEQNWLTFDADWQRALARFGIQGAFHMTEFMREPRTALKRDWILGTLAQIINKHVMELFIHAVDMDAYRRYNDIYTLEECHGAPIALAARSLATEIRAWTQSHLGPDDYLSVFIEAGTKHYGDIEQVFKRDRVPLPVRVPKSNPRLQPADMLGWEAFRYLKSGFVSKNMKRLLPKARDTFGGIFRETDFVELCNNTAVPTRANFTPIDTIAFHSERKRKRKRTIY